MSPLNPWTLTKPWPQASRTGWSSSVFAMYGAGPSKNSTQCMCHAPRAWRSLTYRYSMGPYILRSRLKNWRKSEDMRALSVMFSA